MFWLKALRELQKRLAKHVDDAQQKMDLSAVAAEAVVLKCLTYFGMRREALCRMAKSAPEKMLMAGLLRYKFPVSASWIAQTLCMGHYTIVSKAVKFYDEAQGEWAEKKRDIIKLSD